jgi:hypothetical protein
MRNNLEKMALIDDYLMGQMNKEQMTSFKKEMDTNPDLKNDVDFQKALIAGLQLNAAKANIAKASKQYHFRKMILNSIIVAVAVSGLIAAAVVFTKSEKHSQKPAQSESMIESTEEAVNSILPADTTVVTPTSEGDFTLNPAPVREENRFPFMEKTEDRIIEGPEAIGEEEVAKEVVKEKFYVPESPICSPKKIISQFHNINANRDTVFYGTDGAEIVYRANSLMTAEGKIYKGIAIFEMKEVTSLETMIRSGLTTTSDGEIIESGGMVYLQPTDQEANNLLMVNSKATVINIPTDEYKPNMMVFKGVEVARSSKAKEDFESSDDFFQVKGTTNWIDPQPLNTIIDNPIEIIPDTSYVDGNLRSRKDGAQITDDKMTFWDVLFPNRRKKNRTFNEQIPVINPPLSFATVQYGPGVYSLTISGYGWVNCDRFLNDPRAVEVKYNVRVYDDSLSASHEVMLMLPKHKVFLKGFEIEDNKYIFGKERFKLPPDAFYIVLVSTVSNGKVYYSYQAGNVGANNVIPIFLKEGTEEELSRIIADFGKVTI